MSDFTLSMIRAFLHRLPSAYDLNKLRIIQRKRAKIKADKAKTRAQEPTKPRARVKTSKRWYISERLKLDKQIGHKLHLDLRQEVNSYPCLSVSIRKDPWPILFYLTNALGTGTSPSCQYHLR